MSSFLSRDAIFAVPDIQSEDVFVPQWSGTVRVKGLTARERDQFEADILRGKGKNVEVVKQNLRAKLVVRAAVDEVGDGASGADTDHHAVLDEIECALGGESLLFVAIHVFSLPAFPVRG